MTAEKKDRKKNYKRAAKAGAVTAIVLGLLGALSFIPGLKGRGDGDGEGEEKVETKIADTSPSKIEDPPTDPITEDGSTNDEPKLQPLDLVDIVIAGDEYWVGTGQDGEVIVRESQELAQIIAASKATSGNDAGILIRIARTPQATAQAERDLLAALREAGLNDDQIDNRRTLTDFAPPA